MCVDSNLLRRSFQPLQKVRIFGRTHFRIPERIEPVVAWCDSLERKVALLVADGFFPIYVLTGGRHGNHDCRSWRGGLGLHGSIVSCCFRWSPLARAIFAGIWRNFLLPTLPDQNRNYTIARIRAFQQVLGVQFPDVDLWAPGLNRSAGVISASRRKQTSPGNLLRSE